MQYLAIPETPIIHGEEAIKALNEYIAELKKDENPLGGKQRTVMIKLAEGLINSVKAETKAHESPGERDTTKLKTAKKARFPNFFTNSEKPKYPTMHRVRERLPLL